MPCPRLVQASTGQGSCIQPSIPEPHGLKWGGPSVRWRSSNTRRCLRNLGVHYTWFLRFNERSSRAIHSLHNPHLKISRNINAPVLPHCCCHTVIAPPALNMSRFGIPQISSRFLRSSISLICAKLSSRHALNIPSTVLGLHLADGVLNLPQLKCF